MRHWKSLAFIALAVLLTPGVVAAADEAPAAEPAAATAPDEVSELIAADEELFLQLLAAESTEEQHAVIEQMSVETLELFTREAIEAKHIPCSPCTPRGCPSILLCEKVHGKLCCLF